MTGIPCVRLSVCLAILVSCQVAYSQTGDGSFLIPVEDPIEQQSNDGVDPNSCLGRCQDKCQALPQDCEFIGDNLPVNCQKDKKVACKASCPGLLCPCEVMCTEECTATGQCDSDCLDKCFNDNGFTPGLSEQEEVIPPVPSTTGMA